MAKKGRSKVIGGNYMCKRRLNIFKKIAEGSADILKNEIRNYYKTKSRKLELETSIDNIPGEPVRTISQLVRDKILTTKILLPDRGQDLRTKALCQILCCIPCSDYENLKKRFKDGKILVQIPSAKVGGYISRIKRDVGFVLYLSPQLESCKYSYILNTVGHELSHLLLHSDFSSKNKSLIEKQASLKTLIWGY